MQITAKLIQLLPLLTGMSAIDKWPKVSEDLKTAFYSTEELVEKISSGQLNAEDLNIKKVQNAS